ncbi:TadE/TadG family type IV pilus assembly protein [Roseibium sp.]|uniref:TadE/TadG family type IV pilus assembly protein n=1 Tax=Roseibium sp. TaxID=1936156 RepID=UPI003A9713ED
MSLKQTIFEVRRFVRDTRAIAAVEFALILPFLLILLIGVAETTSALNHSRKVSQIAGSVADLVAQAEQLSAAEAQDIMTASNEILAPYTTATLQVIIASVTFDEDGNPEVDWSIDQDGDTPWARGSEPTIEIPDQVALPGTSIVIGQSFYTYIPMFATLAQNIFPRATAIPMGDVYFLRPRLTNKVLYTG